MVSPLFFKKILEKFEKNPNHTFIILHLLVDYSISKVIVRALHGIVAWNLKWECSRDVSLI